MFGLESILGSLLMQITVPDSISSTIVAVTALMTTVGGLIPVFIKLRAQGRSLTDREKEIITASEYAQLAAQKTKENMAEVNAFVEALYNSLPEGAKAQAKERLKPLLDAAAERIITTDEQIQLLMKALNINVDSNPQIPRESRELLKELNNQVLKSRLGVKLN